MWDYAKTNWNINAEMLEVVGSSLWIEMEWTQLYIELLKPF